MNKGFKKETLQEYLARGGKITICPPGRVPKAKGSRRRRSESQLKEEIDVSNIPVALRISLGMNK